MPEEKVEFNEIGEKLKTIREEQGVSQRTMMIRTGIAQKTISRVENGLDTPKLDTVMRMAQAIGMKLELVEGEPWKKGDTQEEETG